MKWQQRVEAGKWFCGGVVEDVLPADGGRKVRTMMDRSWPPGSADVPVGSHFAARLGVLLHGTWRPRARSEVRCGWGKSNVVADVEPADEKKLMVVGCG